MNEMLPASPLTPRELWDWWETLLIGTARPIVPTTPREIMDYHRIYGKLPPHIAVPSAPAPRAAREDGG